MRNSMQVWSVALCLSLIGYGSFVNSASAQRTRRTFIDGSGRNETDSAMSGGNQLFVPKSNTPKDDLGDIIGKSIIGGFNDGMRSQRRWPDNNSNNNNKWRNDDDDEDEDYDEPRYQQRNKQRYQQPAYPQYTPQYTPQSPASPKPVAVRANPKAPEKINVVRDNPPMNLTDTVPVIHGRELSLIEKVFEDRANEALDEFVKQFEPAASQSPAAQALIAQAQQDIADGKPLDPDFAQKLADATAGQLGPDFKQADADAQLLELLKVTNENAQVQAEEAGGDTALIDGLVELIFLPEWPADEMGSLPNGCVVVGTGGEGTISTGEADAGEVYGVPVGVGEPEPDSTGDVGKRVKSGVLLMNPVENGAPISYVVANANYDMQPGYTQSLAEDQTWEIRFDRGQGHGEARYSLTNGTYAFGPSEKGWELYRQSFGVTIDNSDNESVFYYNIDNSQQEVAGGAKHSHTSLYPILVLFDRGDGGKDAQKKITEKDAQLKLGVNLASNTWDLFPVENYAEIAKTRETKGSVASATAGKKKSVKKDSGRAARLRALQQASNQ